MRWLEEEQLWEATLQYLAPGTGDLSSRERQELISKYGKDRVCVAEERVRAKVVCTCVGGFTEPNAWPEGLPPKDEFEGPIFHSSKWKSDVRFDNKDVVVVGTGCSAAQIVPKLGKPPFNARSITQIMRSPPWVAPRAPPPFGERWTPILLGRVPGLSRIARAKAFIQTELDFQVVFINSWLSKEGKGQYEDRLHEYRKSTVPEKYQSLLRPNYSAGCKRRIFDKTWFPSLHEPNIELTDRPVKAVKANSIVLGPPSTSAGAYDQNSNLDSTDREIPADIIVQANGFEVFNWLHPLKVVGKNGADLHQVWEERGGAQAYMGSAVDGFPNFFIILGPNTVTGHSSVILASELMVEYTIKFIRKILKGDVDTFEVKKEAEVAWTKDVQRDLKDTVFQQGSCTSWYKLANGWNSVAYP